MSTEAKCERHEVWFWQMPWANINDDRPAQQLCPLCLAADLADLKELTNRRIATILVQIEKFRIELSELGLRTDNHNASRKSEIEYLRADIEKFRIELSELGLRTDNHNASRKSEIEYLRADVDRIDRINEGTLLALEQVVKMGPARELRLIGAKLVSRVADWLGGAK